MAIVQGLVAIIRKDILMDFRRRLEPLLVLVFSFAAGVLTAYTTRVSPLDPGLVFAAGTLLVAVFIAVFASLSSFVREAERGTLDGLRVSPIPPEVIYIAKMVYSYVLIAVQSLVYLASAAYFSQAIDMLNLNVLLIVLVFSLYLASLSSFVSALLVYSEARAVLMPITILVLVLPYAQNASRILAEAALGIEPGISEALMLAGVAVAFTAIVLWLSRFILEAV